MIEMWDIILIIILLVLIFMFPQMDYPIDKTDITYLLHDLD